MYVNDKFGNYTILYLKYVSDKKFEKGMKNTIISLVYTFTFCKLGGYNLGMKGIRKNSQSVS